MKNVLTLLYLLLLVCFTSFAQTKIDTVYIKSLYEKTNTTKRSAFYYRVRTISDGVLKATDYDIDDSTKKSSGYYKSFDPYIKHGYFYYYSNDSVISSEGNYTEDEMSGVWKNYYPTGQLWYTETYVNGLRNGLLNGYYRTGEVKRIESYTDGKRIAGKCYSKSGMDTAYYEMQIMPSFPGGEKARIDYIVKNVTYPKEALKNKIQGVVYVSFIVNKDGSISNVEIVKDRGVDPLLDNEAIRCVKSMPTWTPGYNDGDPVKVRLIQKIKFTISKNNKCIR